MRTIFIMAAKGICFEIIIVFAEGVIAAIKT